MSTVTAYEILMELRDNLTDEDCDELREALEAGACALAAFVRIDRVLEKVGE